MHHDMVRDLPVESLMGTRDIYLDDTTLRDGEQTAGVVFSNHEKVRIAKLLDEIGVHQIEVGIPAMGGDEKETIKKIVNRDLRIQQPDFSVDKANVDARAIHTFCDTCGHVTNIQLAGLHPMHAGF